MRVPASKISAGWIGLLLICLGACVHQERKGEQPLSFSDISFFEKEEKVKQLPLEEYINWMSDNEASLLVKKEIDGFLYQLKYNPVDFLAIKEQRSLKAVTESVKRSRKEYEGLQYYTLTLKDEKSKGEFLKNSSSSYQEYDRKLNYIAFGMQNDIKLVQGQDTLPCLLYHFERDYGVSSLMNISLAFKDSLPSNVERTLVIQDRLMENGLVKLKMEKDFFNHIPNLLIK